MKGNKYIKMINSPLIQWVMTWSKVVYIGSISPSAGNFYDIADFFIEL